MWSWTDSTTLGVLYYISEWAIRITMLMIIPFRRSPAAAKGWLLLIFFLPWVGLLVFVFVGRNRLPEWRLQRLQESRAQMVRVSKRLRDSPNLIQPQFTGPLAQAVLLARNLGDMPILDANQAELLSDYDGAIERLIADIDNASHHVHLLYYIFANDATGQRVMDAMARAVKRGVCCRVLMDAVGTGSHVKILLRKMQQVGIQAFPMLPTGLFGRKSARYDLRNHRKIAVIDGAIGYTGSQNIVNADFKAGITYEELVVRITGPVVLELQAVFLADWYQESDELLDAPDFFPEPKRMGNVLLQVLPSGPAYERENNQRMFLALIHGAQERVVITTPYFVPDEALLQALQTAVLRGVEVHLVMNKMADQLLVSLAQKSYYEELLESGVEIHLYKAKFLHAKHLSIDSDVCLIGSSNMDIRSFQLNNEISVLIYDTGVTNQLAAEQQRYFAGSELLTLEEWDDRSFASKMAEAYARLLSPLL